MTRDDVLAILRQFKEDHAQQYSIQEIGIFSSVAQGETGPDSDVDIVFQTDMPNLFHTASMKVELERLLSQQVDIVRFQEGMNPNLKRRIQEEALYV